jgi:hypothetical protein
VIILIALIVVGWLLWRKHQRARRVAFLRWYVEARIALALRDDRMRRATLR